MRRQHSTLAPRDRLGAEQSTDGALLNAAARPASVRDASETVLALQRSHGNAWVSRQLAQGPRSSVPSRPAAAGVSRQPFGLGRPALIPPELLRSADVRSLNDKELAERHDAITKLLAQFRVCPAAPKDAFWLLTSEAKRAGIELARRAALQAGRTFSDDEVKAARDAFEANARKSPKDEGGDRRECIVILNHVLMDIWKDPSQKHTNDTIEKTMALFQGVAAPVPSARSGSRTGAARSPRAGATGRHPGERLAGCRRDGRW